VAVSTGFASLTSISATFMGVVALAVCAIGVGMEYSNASCVETVSGVTAFGRCALYTDSSEALYPTLHHQASRSCKVMTEPGDRKCALTQKRKASHGSP
jgi:hypothetical protein